MLLTRPPLSTRPKPNTPFDLHVLGTPPAFVLSQDQTRHPSIKHVSHNENHDGLRCLSTHPTGICVVCTTQSYDMTLHSHHNALSSPNGLRHRTRNSICVLLLLTLQLSRCLASNDTQPLLISASPRLSRDTPLDYHRPYGTVKRVIHATTQKAVIIHLKCLCLWGAVGSSCSNGLSKTSVTHT